MNLVGTEASNISTIEYLDEYEDMVDLGVVDVHCYYANGVLTHNCAEELRLAANFSRDPVLLEPLKAGKDVHTHIALKMFGFSDPEHRTHVKVINFGVMYGMQEIGLSNKIGKPVAFCKELLEKYKRTLCKLDAWKQDMIKTARKTGMLYTYFGRPRLMWQIYNKPGMSSFGDRTASNSPIQGCVPQNTYMETEHEVLTFKEGNLQAFKTYDGKKIIPSYRGDQEVYLFWFTRGDFIVCDMNHKLINGSDNDLRESPVTGGFKKKVNLSQLHKKKWPNFKMLFKASNEAAVALKLICRTKTRLNDKDSKIAAYFWKLAFTRHRFVCDPMVAASLRSLGSLYGFNVLYVQSCDEYTVRFTRSKKARFAGFKYVGKSPVACATVELGKQMFPTQGFWNKNTGGDVMRMCLCNLFSEQRNNPDFAKNVDIVLHVHDECNFYVEPSYLYEAWKIIKRIMTIHPANFEVPLEVDMGVGYDWGHCLDFKEVTPDNKIVIDLE